MKHYDETPEAIQFMVDRAQKLMQADPNLSEEDAVNQAVEEWAESLERLQAKKRYEDELRNRNIPTLSASLGDLLKFKGLTRG